jgi:hypothetical protein
MQIVLQQPAAIAHAASLAQRVLDIHSQTLLEIVLAVMTSLYVMKMARKVAVLILFRVFLLHSSNPRAESNVNAERLLAVATQWYAARVLTAPTRFAEIVKYA